VKRLWLRLQACQLWDAPNLFVGYLLVVVAIFAAVGIMLNARTAVTLEELLRYTVLLSCAAVCVEATRRLGRAAGIVSDLQSVWTLPIAFVLPPVYALLAPLPLKALSQLRVGRSLVYRRVLSATAIGLGNCAASELFHRLLGDNGVRDSLMSRPTRTVLTGLGCAAVGYLVNTVLIAAGVRLADVELPWLQALLDRESLTIDLVEVCMGLVVFIAFAVAPVTIVVLLPPAVLLQRSLTYAQMRTAARTDAKTGLLNAGAWHQEAEREIVRATRDQRPLAVLMIDLDNFKAFNDTRGHLAGDDALVAVAHSLVAGLRVYDQLGRFGGEEFAVVLPSADESEARRVAERLRLAVAELPIPGLDTQTGLTVSIGAAVLQSNGASLIDMLAAADLALYRAKAGGRNQVAFAPGLPAPPPPTPSTRHPASDSHR